MFLLDTNVVSEFVRPRPDERVLAWLDSQDARDLYLSALTLGELELGTELMVIGARRTALERWSRQEIPVQFAGRIVPIDALVARAWGQIAAGARLRGRPLQVPDGLIVATAQVHGLTLVTRNTRDCAGRGVPTLDPWA